MKCQCRKRNRSKAPKNIQFGPTWLKQFSPHENSKDSPDVAFQLAKHRYGTEEMLSIYENIEKCLFKLPVPVGFTTDFEELYKKDIQEPVLLSSETEEEKVKKKNLEIFLNQIKT